MPLIYKAFTELLFLLKSGGAEWKLIGDYLGGLDWAMPARASSIASSGGSS